jgi:hypothetical protein
VKRFISLLVVVLTLLFVDGTCWSATTHKSASKVTLSATIRSNEKGGKVDLAKAPGYKDALAEFSKGHWGPCADKLEQLNRAGFGCDLVHYYLAQCYENTHQLQQAQMHYGWVTSFSKDKKLREYANYASTQLEYYGAHRTYGGQGNNFDYGRTAHGHGRHH